MKRRLRITKLFGFLLFLCFLLTGSAVYIVNLRQNLEVKNSQILSLQAKAQKRDPFIDYALSLQKYDSKGATPRPFFCFDRKPPEKMTPHEKYWYDTAKHNPVISVSDPKMAAIENDLKAKGTQANQICHNQKATDYLAVYRYEYEKGLFKDSADLYRFQEDLPFETYHLSDNFDFLDIISWLSNGDLIYDPNNGDHHTVYVFTAANNDLLLEICTVEMGSELTNGNPTASFTCKNFNDISHSPKYLPTDVLETYIGRRTF